PWQSLRPWAQLTMGVPAALAESPGAGAVARELAALQGCERATLGPSTLHLFWDLFGKLPRDAAIYLDTGAYQVARWGVERAEASGVPVHRLLHYDPGALQEQIKRDESGRMRPFVVADGLCPGCGRVAPVEAYLEIARDMGGYLILDDTQALGILGHAA